MAGAGSLKAPAFAGGAAAELRDASEPFIIGGSPTDGRRSRTAAGNRNRLERTARGGSFPIRGRGVGTSRRGGLSSSSSSPVTDGAS
jgi:hypothetical protein